MVGIPGDWTPPSRFVRISTLLRFAAPPDDSSEGVNLAEHLLNSVDIPQGEIRTKDQEGGDYTQWVVIKDLTNQVFYFRSYKDLCLKMVDLKKLNFDVAANGVSLPIDAGKGYIDMTKTFNGRAALDSPQAKRVTNCTRR